MLSQEIRGLLEKTTTSAVCDVLMRRGQKLYMRSRIRPLDLAVRMAGQAVTASSRMGRSMSRLLVGESLSTLVTSFMGIVTAWL